MIVFKIITIVMLWTISFSADIHNLSVPKIEGGTQQFSVFLGKKLMIITLPVVRNAAADSILYSLDTLAAAHQSNLVIIAVPSFEDGYTASQNSTLQQWYRSKLGNYIVVTRGLYCRKTSGSQQHDLFKWLTNKNKNEKFDIDVESPGYKFFINGNGGLYGVFRTNVRIGSLAVNKALRIQ